MKQRWMNEGGEKIVVWALDYCRKNLVICDRNAKIPCKDPK
jgi:hypothetical protein